MKNENMMQIFMPLTHEGGFFQDEMLFPAHERGFCDIKKRPLHDLQRSFLKIAAYCSKLSAYPLLLNCLFCQFQRIVAAFKGFDPE